MHPEYKLVLAANRDEFYQRPTRHADWWKEQPDLLAGKDLEGGGSWMGIHREGNWAALTNYRNVGDHKENAPTRGKLVTDFLTSGNDPEEYIQHISKVSKQYNGFNLIVGNSDAVWYFSNKGAGPQSLSPGIYGLSNHLLNTPWPKVKRGVEGLQEWNKLGVLSTEELFTLLKQDQYAPDDQLPSTGVSLEWERILSAVFIKSPAYGTRVSTILTISYDHHAHFEERNFDPAGETRIFRFDICAKVPVNK